MSDFPRKPCELCFVVREADTWRLVTVRQDQGEAGTIEADLLRPLGFFGGQWPNPGDKFNLDLPRLGLSGPVEVTAIADCPIIPPGPGRIVLSVFRHSRGSTGTLHLSGHPEPIRVTPLHPIWSPSHDAWIPAGKLTPAHDVSLWKSTCRVERYELDAWEEPVYNVEVDGDHCYRVGEWGVLVHNDSDEPKSTNSDDDLDPCDPCKAANTEASPSAAFPRSPSGAIQATAETGKLVEAVPSRGFHGTSGITVDEVIANGLPDGGTNINLAEHVGGAKDSAFRGLGPVPGRGGSAGLRTPVEFAGEGGVVVEVEGVPGFDTGLHAPNAVQQLPKGEAEIATPRRIPTERIKRVGKVSVDCKGREVVKPGDWTRNPNYTPNQ